MNKKDFEQLLKNKLKLQMLKYEMDEMSYKSIVGSQEITGMPFVGGTSDKVGDYVARLTTLEDKYISLMLLNDRLLRRAKLFIREVPDNTIQSILYLKYIGGHDNLDIADTLGVRGPHREQTIKKTINTFFLDCLLYL